MKITIAGGGVSGLSLAYYLLREKPSLDLTVLESEERLGGKIWTDKTEGFLCESGVNGFLDNKQRTLELIADLSLSPLKSSNSARKRFIYSEGALRLLPESPPAFFKSNLLSLRGRLRIIYELFAPAATEEDESLAGFAKRRLGREAYEKLIDPMASGIYAGDPEALSLKSCFPRIHELEKQYGSLIKAFIKLKGKARKEGTASPGAGPGGVLTSFYDGMGSLIEALRNSLGARVRINSRLLSIDRKAQQYVLHLSDGTRVETDMVIMAVPAYAASEILKNLDRVVSKELAGIQYPSVAVVCAGYKKDKAGLNLDGFGFLVPFREGRKILGTLWDSSIFPNRAPAGYALLRTMVGGARASALATQTKGRLMDTVTEELSGIMGIKERPDFVRIYSHERAIPQYNTGHQKKLRNIEDLLLKYKGLYITGNAYRGISVNDCIENSYMLANSIAAETNL